MPPHSTQNVMGITVLNEHTERPNSFYFVTVNQALQHLPASKQKELELLTALVSSCKKVEMIILFGSYARNTWVEHQYIEKGILYEYRSDFDILVVLSHNDTYLQFKIEGKVNTELVDTRKVKTPTGLIFHGIKHLNEALKMGNYFFRDIKKEGIILFDSGRHKLAKP